MTDHPKERPEPIEPELTRWHRDLMLEKLGMIHESDLAALSSTIRVSRRRWDLEGVLLGCEKYFRISDIGQMLENKLNEKSIKQPKKPKEDVISLM